MAITYYSTGTISLTNGSAVVTGNGTAWQTAQIAGGVVHVQAPSGNPLPICAGDPAFPITNTQLTSVLAWTGPTGTYSYAIARQDDVNQVLRNAQALSEYVQRLDSDALGAIAGLPPQAESIAVFTGPTTAVVRPLNSAFTSDNLSYAGRGATLIAEGDSLSAGYLLTDPSTESWFAQFANMKFAAGALATHNVSIPGSTVYYSETIAEGHYVSMPRRYAANVRPYRPTANGGVGGPRSYLFFQGLTNDIIHGRTASQIIADLTYYVTTAKSDGFIVVLGTATPYSNWNPAQEDTRLAVNAAIRRGDIGADIVWSMDEILTNPYDTDTFPDGGHYSAKANRMLAKYLDNGMRNGFSTSSDSLKSAKSSWETIGRRLEPAGTTHTDFVGLGAYRLLRLRWDILPVGVSSGMAFRTSRNNGASWDQGAGDYTYHGASEVSGNPSPLPVANLHLGPLVDSGMGNNMAFGEFEIAAFNTPSLGTFHSNSRYWSSPTVAHRSTTVDGYVGVSGARNALTVFATAGSYSGLILLEGVRG